MVELYGTHLTMRVENSLAVQNGRDFTRSYQMK